MSGGAHTRWHARQSARDDLATAIAAAKAGELFFTCRSCRYLHGTDIIAEHLQLGPVLAADVTDHRLTSRQRHRLALALGRALLGGP